jgi:predicted transposase/invertase (TIGR01784 family)
MTLKLSDAFKEAGGLLGAGGRPFDLELTPRVYNINPGHNAEILKKCEELNGYSVFVGKVREYVKTIPGEKAAFKKAINDCIEQDILREFLKLHSSEVLNMLLEEWNLEDALEAEREEAWEEGRADKAGEVAKNLLALGVSPATIAKATGLPMETIQEIAAAPGA